MVRAYKGFAIALAAVFLAGAALAQEHKSTTTEKRNFEILSVDGNKVVVRGKNGVRELTLPPDFKLTMDGKEIGLADLKPGMKGSAVITTTVTTKPVVVTEVRNAEVLAVTANNLIVRGKNGVRKFTLQEINDRNITLYKDGAPVDMNQLRKGDKLSATIITRHPPVVITEQNLQAAVDKPDEPVPAPAAAAPAAAEPAPAPAAAEPAPAPAKKLPKTGSELPLLALVGSLFLGAGLCLSLLRRSRKTA